MSGGSHLVSVLRFITLFIALVSILSFIKFVNIVGLSLLLWLVF